MTLAEAILAIANGATGADSILLQNKITVALDFTTKTTAAGQGLGTPNQAFLDEAHKVLTGVDGTALNDASVTAAEAETTQFIASGAGLRGTTLSFTTSVDNLVGTGGSDFFNGTVTGSATQTFNPGDTANGGSGGVDRVSVVDTFSSGANELAGVNFVHIDEFLDQNVSGGQTPPRGTKAAANVSQALRQAMRLHRRGRLTHAEPLYRAILTAQSHHFDALHLLGVMRYQQGRHTEA